MRAIEFETNLQGCDALPIPKDVAQRLPQSGKARVIVLFEQDGDDDAWRKAAYEHLLREDDPEDAVYDKYKP